MIRAHKPAWTLPLVLALALISIAGLVGMLLADGLWDGLFFLSAGLPLGAGGCWLQQRRRSRSPAH